MIYAKWKLVWQGDPSEGYGPELTAKEQGASIEGAFFETLGDPSSFIYGYVSDNLDFEKLTSWQMSEVAQAEILQKARDLDPECYIDDNGQIVAPRPEQT
jgi:hypothetical protein